MTKTMLAFVALCVSLPSTSLSQQATTHKKASASTQASVQALQQAASDARERGEIEASIKLYERALEQKPDWQEGWWYDGSLHYDQSQYAAAVRAFRKLLQLNSKLGDARAMLGLSEYETQDYVASYSDLEKATTDGSDLEESLRKVVDYHRAVLLNVRGDSDAAYMVLSSLFLRGVHSEDLQVALGLSLLRVPVFPNQLDPKRDALIHEAGNIASFMAQKQFDKAEVAFQDLIKQYPTSPNIHYAYGAMLASSGRDQDAEAQFHEETQINPDSALPYMEWAFVESKAKHYSASIDLAKKAVDRSSDSFMAHYLLGNGLLMSGDAAAARPELETAQKLAPEVADIRYSLSRVYARLGESALAKEEQTQFIALQRKNALDRVKLLRLYPNAQAITGVRPTTN